MIDLSARVDLPELMDAADVEPAVYKKCLIDLAGVNRLTMTHRSTLKFLQRTTKNFPIGSKISVIDLASGHGDLLRAIAQWGAMRGFVMSLTGVDLNPRGTKLARDATPPDMIIDFQTASVFDFESAEAPDFIVTSQFTHHLADGDIVRLVQRMESHATKGWHIVDLHRHAIPYYGFRLLCRLMRWHSIVRYDGTMSIARSFRRADWEGYLAAAGLHAEISWQPLFRYAISRVK